MKSITLILVASLLLGSCTKSRQAQGPPSPTLASTPPTLGSASAGDLRKAGNQNLRAATAVLQQLTSEGSDTLPDAVLSRAKCLVLRPAAGAPEIGTVTCRNGNGWSAPTFAKVREISTTPKRDPEASRRQEDLLIFIMSDRGLQALLSGTIKFGADVLVNAGPLLQEVPIVTDVELKAGDGLAYLHKGKSLRGVAVDSGTLQLDDDMSRRVYGGGTPRALLEGRYRASSPDKSFDGMVNSFFYLIRPSGIIVHHSVLLPEPSVAERALDEFHSRRGFSIYCFGRAYHVAYHYLVLPDGSVKAGRPERCQGAHTRGYNSYLGIAMVGDFSSLDNADGKKGRIVPTASQMRSLVRLCRELRARYKIPLHRILRHSDISNTQCPGDRFLFKQFLAELEHPSSAGY